MIPNDDSGGSDPAGGLTGTIPTYPHTAYGSEQLTEAQARAYLHAQGYEDEAGPLMAEARRFPGIYAYTANRHRYVAFFMPGGFWKAGDCAESEERIKAAGRQGRRRW